MKRLLLALVLLPFVAGAQTKINQIAENITTSTPILQTVTNNAVTTVFGTNSSRGDDRVLLRTIQNTGTTPVLYLINSTNISTTNYHGVIAAGSAARDGLGSVVDFSRIPWPITLKCETSFTVVALVELRQ